MKFSSCFKVSLVLFVAGLAYIFLATPPQGLEANDLGQFPPPMDLLNSGLDLDRLANARYIEFPENGVEDVEVDSKGNIYTAVGYQNSAVFRVRPGNLTRMELLAKNNGQILGIALSPNERQLALADQTGGLKLLDIETGKIKTLASGYQGKAFVSLNSVTFSDDETIFFTHTGEVTMKEFHYELLSKGTTGRVYKYSLKTQKLQIFVDYLRFPNGIAYSKKDKCLYVNHLNKYEIIRIPIDKKENDNNYEVVASNLPGSNDNLKITEDNKLWVALPAIRDSITNFVDNNAVVRKAIINSRIPLGLFMALANMKVAGAIKVNPENGEIEDFLLGKPDEILFVTGAYQRGKKVYLASLMKNKIAIVDL